MERRAAALLNKLMENINGWSCIAPVSGWRSEQEQRDIWNNSMRESGGVFTRQYVAVPGCSEHQTGLAIDLGLYSSEMDFIRPEFPNTGICQMFRRHAAKYGFVERYPADKDCVTGIAHEPWHFRYVGAPHAEIMEKLGLVLEEYHIMLKNYVYGTRTFKYDVGDLAFDICYLPAAAMDDMPAEKTESTNLMLSGNNSDGYIITEWREK